MPASPLGLSACATLFDCHAPLHLPAALVRWHVLCGRHPLPTSFLRPLAAVTATVAAMVAEAPSAQLATLRGDRELPYAYAPGQEVEVGLRLYFAKFVAQFGYVAQREIRRNSRAIWVSSRDLDGLKLC